MRSCGFLYKENSQLYEKVKPRQSVAFQAFSKLLLIHETLISP